MSEHASRRFNIRRVLLLLLILVLGVAGVFSVLYFSQVKSLEGDRDEANRLIREMSGVDNPRSTNGLDARYADANGDLLADTPADASKLIDPPVLKFCYIAVEDHAKFKSGFTDLLAAISKATGKPVEYVEYVNADDQLRALRDGELQIAGLNTGLVPVGVCLSGFVPTALMADAAGNATYQMEIITAKSSPVQELAALKNREVTFTDPSSNSGYKAAIIVLRDNKLKPGDDFHPVYSQGHRQSIEGIKSGTYESAAVAGDVLKREVAEGAITPADFRVIYSSSESFPSAALGYAYNLKPELAAKIRQAILDFAWKKSSLEKAFAAEGRAKFVPADYRKDWEYVREIDDSIGVKYIIRDAEPATQPTTQPIVLPPVG